MADEDKAAKIAAAKAKHDAAVAAERAQMEANLAKALKKKPLTDAEAQKMKSSITGEKPEAPEAPKNKGDLAKRATKKAKTPKPNIPEGVNARTEYIQNIERNAARSNASTAAPELPHRPLPGQGSMVDKPVERVLVKTNPNLVSEEGVKKWKADVDAERRITQGSAPGAERRAALQAQKVMTPSGAVEATVPKPPADSFAEMRAAGRRGFGAVQAQVDDSVREAYKASVRLGNRAGQTLAHRAGTAAAKGAKWAGSNTGKALIGLGKSVTEPLWKPVTTFIEGHAGRKAAHVAADVAASSATSLKGRVAARAAQGAAAARTAGAVGMMGGRFAVGGAKLGLEGLGAAFLWETGKGAAMAETGSRATMNRHVRSGKAQGLTVTHAEPSFARMAFGGSPKIKVHDPSQDVGPDGKSLSQKRREKGQAIFEYNQAKAKAGRNVIKGSSK